MMDFFGRSAAARLAASIAMATALSAFWLAGCTNSNEQFESYGRLKRVSPDPPQTAKEKVPSSAPDRANQPVSAVVAAQAKSARAAAPPADVKPSIELTSSQLARTTTDKKGKGLPDTQPATAPPPPTVVPPANGSTGKPAVLAAAGSPARKVHLLIPDRTFRKEGTEQALRVSYDDIDLLKVLDMDPVTPDAPAQMPAWLKGLDGQRIRIRGFMYPTFQQTGIRAFALARDNQICCFGRNPKIYDVFDVALKPGTTTNYIPNRPFDVVGVFHIRPESEEGKLYHLYEMDDAVVITK